MEKSRHVELDIVNAARKVFREKGYKEATMRDIAAQANINMAMLHYYFRSKDNLFFIIFDESLKMLYNNIVEGISNPDLELFEKIKIITQEYITFFNDEPALPPFIIGEIIRNPEKVGQKILDNVKTDNVFKIFEDQLKLEHQKGVIKEISALALVLNILSLCIFPALTKPVMKEIFEGSSTEIDFLMEARKREVAEFVINAIKN